MHASSRGCEPIEELAVEWRDRVTGIHHHDEARDRGPLAHHDDASFDEYLEGARAARAPLAALAERLDMPVLFVEIGYTTRRNAAVEPWLWPDGMTDVAYSEEEQARAMEALVRVFSEEEWFAGFLVWRYYANLDDVSQEAIWGFSPHGKLAEPMVDEGILPEPTALERGRRMALEKWREGWLAEHLVFHRQGG